LSCIGPLHHCSNQTTHIYNKPPIHSISFSIKLHTIHHLHSWTEHQLLTFPYWHFPLHPCWVLQTTPIPSTSLHTNSTNTIPVITKLPPPTSLRHIQPQQLLESTLLSTGPIRHWGLVPGAPTQPLPQDLLILWLIVCFTFDHANYYKASTDTFILNRTTCAWQMQVKAQRSWLCKFALWSD
jgi:hypothetical protein